MSVDILLVTSVVIILLQAKLCLRSISHTFVPNWMKHSVYICETRLATVGNNTAAGTRASNTITVSVIATMIPVAISQI